MQFSLVSVVVPIYNGSEYVENALESVLNQTYKNWECIAIDDGSEDDSFEKASLFARRYPDRFKVFRQENSGQAKARNLGIDNALGNYIAFLDCDDTWHRKKLETQVRALSSRDEFVLSLTSYSISQRKRPRRVVFLRSLTALEKDWARFRGYGGGLESVGLVKADLVKMLKFDESLSTSSGLDLFLRIKPFGKVHLSKSVLMEYRKHPGQWHGNFSELKRNVYRIYQKHFSSEFDLYIKDFERYERLVILKSGLGSNNLNLIGSAFRLKDTPYLVTRLCKYLYSVFAGLLIRG